MPRPPVTPSSRSMPEEIGPLPAALCIVLLTVLAYWNSFAGDFVFDDIHEIARNPSLDRLWPPWEPMFGGKNPARPLPYLSFAIDRAIWGESPFGYHLANLVVHVVAALALFDLTRVSLASPRLRDRWGGCAVPLALVIAGLWAVHPLQTQAVTYVYQRIESMAGMFCLLSLAAFARGLAAHGSRAWLAGSVAACAAAMASKENAVVLPVLLVAYDWFFAPAQTPAEWRSDVRWRLWFHAACFATWIILAAVVIAQAREYQEFGATKRSPLTYALTQPGVILHYLRLALLPVGQCFDYSDWPAVARFEIAQLPACLAIAGVVGLTAYGTSGRKPWAWPGVFLLGTLAPTSSVLPVDSLANEHRMYQPLAAVVVAVVFGAIAIGPRLASRLAGGANALDRYGLAAAALAAITLTTLTHARNDLYRSGTAIWADVLNTEPENYRALRQLAVKLDFLGDERAAFELADRAIDRMPTCDVYADLAAGKLSAGDYPAAERRSRLGLERRKALLPADDRAVLSAIGDLASVVRLGGRIDEAADLSAAAIDTARRVLGPDDNITLRAEQFIAEGLAKRGDLAAAEALARSSLARARMTRPADDPIVVAGTLTFARVLGQAGRPGEAGTLVQRTIEAFTGRGSRREADRLVLEDLRAELLEKAGSLAEVVAVRKRIAAAYERSRGRSNPMTASAVDKHLLAVAALASARGEHARAAEIYGRFVEKYRAALGPDHADTRAMEARRIAAAERGRGVSDALPGP